jgi:heme/copper-type cytochrome/quinol oxidase subunit 2
VRAQGREEEQGVVDVVCSRVTRRLEVVGLVGLVAVLATGCSASEVIAFGWPEGVTEQAERMRTLWIGSVIASLVVGVIVWVLILWPVAFHRKRTDEIPRQFQYNLPLEIFYTVLPLVIVTVLFYFTATTQNFVQAKVEDPDLRVRVVGFQWNWEFQYLRDEAGPDGRFDPMRAPRFRRWGPPARSRSWWCRPTASSSTASGPKTSSIRSSCPTSSSSATCSRSRRRTTATTSSRRRWTRRARSSGAVPSCAARTTLT